MKGLFIILVAAAFSEAATLVAQQSAPAVPQPPSQVLFQADIEYARVGEHRLLLDLALPREPKGKALPLIVFIHGGGWMSGDKIHAWRGQNWNYAATGDYAVASINYRLSGVAPWPACLHDCKAAIRWFKAGAERYGIDPDRIAVWGHSAGGHLVAMLCTTSGVMELEGSVGGNLQFSSRVACGVDEAGPTDFPGYADYKRPPDGLRSPREQGSPEYRLFGGPLEQHGKEMKEASATTYADEKDSPILIVHGSDDTVVPINQAELLQAALVKAGAPVFYVRLNGLGHGVGHAEYRSRRDALFEKYLLGRNVELSGGVFESVGVPASVAARRDTELGKLAGTMKPGSWAELKTAGFMVDVHGGASQVFTNADSAVWSPRTQQLHMVGQGANQPLRFVSWSALDNAWKVLPVPAWWSAEDPANRAGHAHDNNAVDQNAGLLYHHRNGSGEVYYYNVAGGGDWRRLPGLPPTGKPEQGTALVYSPEMNGLLRVYAGTLHVFRRTDRGWSVLKDGIAMGPSDNVAEHNPVRKVIVFGGGRGSADLHQLDVSGGIAPLAKPPVPEVSITATVLTTDPASGDLLLLDRGTLQLAAYDFATARWRAIAALPPLRKASRNIIAAPITNYGVVLFAQEAGPVLVYRHEPSTMTRR